MRQTVINAPHNNNDAAYGLNYVFPSPIYKGRVKDRDALNSLIKDSNIFKSNLLERYQGFEGEFTTSFAAGRHSINEKWMDILGVEIINGATSLMGVIIPDNQDKCMLTMNNMWLNYYEKGHYQEYHYHLPACLSFVYYVQIPNNSSKKGSTVFVNPNHKMNSGFVFNSPLLSDFKHVGEEGDFIIFPSYMGHYVLHHNSDDQHRITVSGNLLLNLLPDTVI